MELEVLETRGIPSSAVLSISAGGTRKQVQRSAIDRPLRFPPADDKDPIKVDVLDVRGRARLPYQASGERYTLDLKELDTKEKEAFGSQMEVDIVTRPCDPDSPTRATEELDAEVRRRKEQDASGYLEEHGLVNFVQFLLHSLMQDKPADPYPFLQKQLAMRISNKTGTSPTGARAPPTIGQAGIGGAPDIPALSTLSMMTVPAVADSGDDISSMLQRLSPQAASSVAPEDIEKLERQALEASQRLRADNAKLRETAESMKLEYEKLMKESNALHKKLDAKRAAKMAAATEEVKAKETQAQRAYREVEKLQDEVAQLAKENAKLVSDLARGREMIEAVRKDMVAIRRTINE